MKHLKTFEQIKVKSNELVDAAYNYDLDTIKKIIKRSKC